MPPPNPKPEKGRASKSPESLTEFHLSEVEQAAYKLFAEKRARINLDSFANLYEKGQIERDKKEVARLEKLYDAKNTKGEKELKKLAELFEVLFGKLVELENWFGENVFIIETSKIDDYKSGVDMIAEFLSEGLSTQLGLAIDVTFSSEKLDKKIGEIAREIREGKLPSIRYFISGNGDRGEKNNIPRVVLGTDRKTIGQLAELLLDLDYLKKRGTDQRGRTAAQIADRTKEIREKLQNHPLQIELLEQIAEQLERFRKYAGQMGKTDIAIKYGGVLSIIRKIMSSKKDIAQSPETRTRDMRMLHNINTSLNQAMPHTISTE